MVFQTEVDMKDTSTDDDGDNANSKFKEPPLPLIGMTRQFQEAFDKGPKRRFGNAEEMSGSRNGLPRRSLMHPDKSSDE